MKMRLSKTRLTRNQNKAGSHSALAWKFWFRFPTRRAESIFVEISDLWLRALSSMLCEAYRTKRLAMPAQRALTSAPEESQPLKNHLIFQGE